MKKKQSIENKIEKEWEAIKIKHPLLNEVEVVSYWILSKQSLKEADKYAKMIEIKQELNEN